MHFENKKQLYRIRFLICVNSRRPLTSKYLGTGYLQQVPTTPPFHQRTPMSEPQPGPSVDNENDFPLEQYLVIKLLALKIFC